MFEIFVDDWNNVLMLLLEHIYMSFTGVLFAILIGVPLAVAMTKSKVLAQSIQVLINLVQTIPSLALLLIVLIFLGLGYQTVIVALFCYSLMPIIQNSFVGLSNVDRNLIEAGIGMGMTSRQLLFQVKIPLSMPVILAGIRVALVIAVGIATIGTLVGAGGLGKLIYRGIATSNDAKLLAGAIPAALLAILLDSVVGRLEKKLNRSRRHAA
ncbi:glycine/betaine ABC transporter [Cohnella kolymensis]|uniref:Glycine/betaine ABC transporter n=2 Tax=Cohnella kolymensis TaxID=1590652 RepID=A0ABR5A186_9BACL|nr:glycine/betaine ABC transporter [Cohnella kolymensis]